MASEGLYTAILSANFCRGTFYFGLFLFHMFGKCFFVMFTWLNFVAPASLAVISFIQIQTSSWGFGVSHSRCDRIRDVRVFLPYFKSG